MFSASILLVSAGALLSVYLCVSVTSQHSALFGSRYQLQLVGRYQ